MRKFYYALIVICVLMTQWPVLLWTNKIEPVVLGLPFVVFWNIMWILIGSAVAFIAAAHNFGEKK